MAALGLPKAWEEMRVPIPLVETTFERLGMENALRGNFNEGIQYFEDVLAQNNKRKKSIFERSKCYSNLAQVHKAHNDAVAAAEIDPRSTNDDYRVCDALYDLNDFEHHKIELARRSRRVDGVKLKQFENRFDIVNGNFNEMIGKAAGDCLHNQRFHIEAAANELLKKDEYYMPRPVWKKLRQYNKCDVMSITSTEEEKLSKRELARRQLNYRIYMQTYLHFGWKDAQFLKDLSKSDILLLPQTPQSTKVLKELVTTEKNKTNTFTKMLHSRCPLYTKSRMAFPKEKNAVKANEDHLYLVQYQTRRDSFNILDRSNELRKQGNIRKLVSFVEKSMSEYFSVKTSRVMPRKFEFINEIYNVVALSYCDKFKIAVDLNKFSVEERLFVLLSLEVDADEVQADVEVDPLEFIDQDRPDYAYLAYKRQLNHYEARIEYTEYPIERCYIFHEIAKLHLTQTKVDDARVLGNKTIAEATMCGHFVYKLLGFMAIVEANVIQRNYGKLKESLKSALEIAPHLKNSHLTKYLMELVKITKTIMNDKRRQSATGSVLKSSL